MVTLAIVASCLSLNFPAVKKAARNLTSFADEVLFNAKSSTAPRNAVHSSLLNLAIKSSSADESSAFGPAAIDIILDSPTDTVLWDPGDTLNFSWTNTGGFIDNFTLKVLELNLTDTVPAVFPDSTGLFYLKTGIPGTTFSYGPTLPAFKFGRKYAWQIIGGTFVAVPNCFFPRPRNGCGLNLNGTPTSPICPGDCFTLTGSFFSTFLGINKRIVVYSDQPSLVAVNGSSIAVHDIGLLANAPLEAAHFVGGPLNYSLDICVIGSSPQPVKIWLYYYEPSSSICATSPQAPTCCHGLQSFSINVANTLDDYTGLQLEIKDPTATNLVTEVCSGDPVHFSILNLPAKAPVQWQCSTDNGTTWLPIPSFTQCNFVTLPNDPSLTTNCGTSTTGFLDKLFRAKFTVTTTGGAAACEYFTTEYPLRICCPITTGTVSVSTADPMFDLNIGLCEGNVVPLDVLLTPGDMFVNPLGAYVDIKWELNSVPLTFDDQTNFSTTVTVGATDLYFKATVSNCAGKSKTFTKCIHVDEKPVCGFIQGRAPTNLTEVSCASTDPVDMRCYTICPGKDAQIEAIGYDKCHLNWEISPDGTTWTPIGSVSNTVQNTNTLFLPGATEWYYRAICEPLTTPSGCDPCTSNVVKIMEILPPAVPLIAVPSDLCKGDPIGLQVANANATLTYTWYCNGLPVGTGDFLSLNADKSACYWVEADNGCVVVESAQSCVTVCEVVASISCPLVPNECASLGIPFDLTATGSFSTCSPSNLTYHWNWMDQFGVAQSSTSLTITDTPPVGGTTYNLVVTDLETGCSDLSQLTIIPCDKN